MQFCCAVLLQLAGAFGANAAGGGEGALAEFCHCVRLCVRRTEGDTGMEAAASREQMSTNRVYGARQWLCWLDLRFIRLRGCKKDDGNNDGQRRLALVVLLLLLLLLLVVAFAVVVAVVVSLGCSTVYTECFTPLLQCRKRQTSCLRNHDIAAAPQARTGKNNGRAVQRWFLHEVHSHFAIVCVRPSSTSRPLSRVTRAALNMTARPLCVCVWLPLAHKLGRRLLSEVPPRGNSLSQPSTHTHKACAIDCPTYWLLLSE